MTGAVGPWGIGDEIRDLAEKECIKVVCFYCWKGSMPIRQAGSWHHSLNDGVWYSCGARAIYELRRKRNL